MVRLAGVKAIRYIGEAPKKLWEVGGRNVPVLNRGDVVLVAETVGLSLSRSRFFEIVEGEVTMDVPLLAAIEKPLPPVSEVFSDEAIDTAFDAPVATKKGK